MPERFSASAIVMLGVAGLRAIWHNKLRSSLTALGITVGIGAVVCVVAIGTAGSHHAAAEPCARTQFRYRRQPRVRARFVHRLFVPGDNGNTQPVENSRGSKPLAYVPSSGRG